MMDGHDLRVLRSLAGGRRVVPARSDQGVLSRLEACRLVAVVAVDRNEKKVWDLTDAGVQHLLNVDGPLSEAEQVEWLSWPKTRFGKEGHPQKLLRGWKAFSVPRARALLERWRRHGIRSSW